MTETLARKNAPLVAAAFRRSRMRKRSVFNLKLRVGNFAMTAAVSNEPSAFAIFKKRLALFETWVTWLKPNAITLMSGVMRPSRWPASDVRAHALMRSLSGPLHN